MTGVKQLGYVLGVYGELTVAATATLMNVNGIDTILHNHSDAIIYIGDADVLVTTGYPLNIDAEIVVTQSVYCISAAGSKALRHIQVR
jgi:hypothetical protein